ncbi:unnamed protein product [Bursaphelenchus xylophilus]|uniref:(pine wood nematode) hypothetical protein n=1 Tax=Bursaphelenchus xylophilus TaxID=6326 RepID=A0A1I7RI02_BURXY|nr:unnamed protein product [Bursaphelenchus xylophilus]CAG9115253.1 unnamed protein product [Bursaphelenchus xylophilus]
MNNIKPLGFLSGSPGTALDRFYRNPSDEEERMFNLVNIRHLFDNSQDSGLGEEMKASRKRSTSIWSTDGEGGESDNSLSCSPASVNETLSAPQPSRQPISLQNPELRRLYPDVVKTSSDPIFPKAEEQFSSLHNPDLNRFYSPPNIHEARKFKLDGLASLFAQE